VINTIESDFKTLINNIRKYDQPSIIIMIMYFQNNFYKQKNDGVRDFIVQTITLDLLLRFVLEYGCEGAKEINNDNFVTLYEKIWNLKWLSEFRHENISMKNITCENIHSDYFRILQSTFPRQLPYYIGFRNEDYANIARYYSIFNDIDNEQKVSARFTNHYKISIKNFIKIFASIFTIIRVQPNRFQFHLDEFKNSFGIDETKIFFDAISLDLLNAKRFLIQHKKTNKIRQELAYQIDEITPLIRYPFLKIKDTYFMCSPNLLTMSSNDIIFNMCKEIDENFCGSYNRSLNSGGFGDLFEKYIFNSLTYYVSKTKSNLLNESDILKYYKRKKTNLIDFLVEENGTNLLIECKSLKMKSEITVFNDREFTIRELKNGILKSTQQILSMLKDPIIKTKDNYGIIITYGDYYLGNNNMYYDEILKYSNNNELNEDDQTFIKNKLFFMSIEDFDYFIEGVVTNHTILTERLRFINFRNLSGFSFKHFLKQWNYNTLPQYLSKSIESLCKDISRKTNDQ
jgi:hypothetical protein